MKRDANKRRTSLLPHVEDEIRLVTSKILIGLKTLGLFKDKVRKNLLITQPSSTSIQNERRS